MEKVLPWLLHVHLVLSLFGLAMLAWGLLASDIPAAMGQAIVGGALLITGGIVMLYIVATTYLSRQRKE